MSLHRPFLLQPRFQGNLWDPGNEETTNEVAVVCRIGNVVRFFKALCSEILNIQRNIFFQLKLKPCTENDQGGILVRKDTTCLGNSD